MPEPCRNICNYYDAKPPNNVVHNNNFKKFCSVCNKSLISKYLRCPCCHNAFETNDS